VVGAAYSLGLAGDDRFRLVSWFQSGLPVMHYICKLDGHCGIFRVYAGFNVSLESFPCSPAFCRRRSPRLLNLGLYCGVVGAIAVDTGV